MAIKAIVFDLWNTLAYDKSKPITKIMKELNIKDVNVLEESFMTKSFETPEQAMLSLCDYLKIEPNKKNMKMLLDIWSNPTLFVFDDVVPVIKKLKKDYKLGLISNFSPFEKGLLEEISFFDMFDAVCLSSDVGLLKPDPKIFRLILGKLGVKPEEALMVGDSLNDDVLAAKKIGMDAILIKRKGDYLLSWEEKGTYKKTIKDLYELLDYLRKNG